MVAFLSGLTAGLAQLFKPQAETPRRLFKNFLAFENARNAHHEEMFKALLKRAFGSKEVIVSGHHFLCDWDNDLKTLNEIPSADTALFDHDIMKAVFGPDRYLTVLSELAQRPAIERDEYMRSLLPELQSKEKTTWWELPDLSKKNGQ